jgi:PAS domain-containing protein
MTDAFYMLDKDWLFTYLNKEAERLLQRPRTDLLGKVIWKECRDLIGTTFEVEFRRAVSQNRAVSFEEVYIPFNSWKELRIFPSDKGPAAYFTEISERKRLQELQRQSEERFKVVARATTDIIWDWDTRADRIWWNEGLQIQFGYAPEDFDHGSGRGRAVSTLKKAPGCCRSFTRPWTACRKTGAMNTGSCARTIRMPM